MATKKISADLSLCQGYGNCAIYADRYFELGDDDVVVVREDVPDNDLPHVMDAIRACPVSALHLEES